MIFCWILAYDPLRTQQKCSKRTHALMQIPPLASAGRWAWLIQPETQPLCWYKAWLTAVHTAQPTALIYHVNFSNSPCSPCWPDNPCRQVRTSHTDRNGNGTWGSAQCVSGYDTPVNQMEMPRCASQRAVVLVLLPKGATDVISLSAQLPTSQITDTTSFYYCVSYIGYLLGFFYTFSSILIFSRGTLDPWKIIEINWVPLCCKSCLMYCQSHRNAHRPKICDHQGRKIKANPFLIHLLKERNY